MFRTSTDKTLALTAAVLAMMLNSTAPTWAESDINDGIRLTQAEQGNRLMIASDATSGPDQQANSKATGNRMTVEIFGNDNGGLGQPWGAPPFDAGFPAPRRIIQTGQDNAITLRVRGERNRFAISQSGADNVATGRITGAHNSAAVVQQGHGHQAVFTQNGRDNTLAITQTSW